MWRAFFLAVGVYVFLLGAECLVVDKAILKPQGGEGPAALQTREFIPAEWAPWSLMSSGAVTVLYSFTVPRRVKS